MGAAPADAEAAVYPELARANLARMRGDYKQAEEVLLAVLRQYPNNPSANEMLGDLAAEREDFAHASNWYELALEIEPTSASIARKLRDARERIDQRDAKATTAQLGLPDPNTRAPWLVGALIVAILVIAGGAYILGTRSPARPPEPVSVIRAEQPPADTHASTTESAPTSATAVKDDQDMTDSLKAKLLDGQAILGVVQDPRSQTMILTFTMPEKDPRALAARIARDTFANLSATSSLTLRGISGGKVVYMADATRERVAEVDTAAWKEEHASEPDAWIGVVLQNEWPAPAPAPPGSSTGSTPPSPGAGTGAGTPTEPGSSGTPGSQTGGGQ